MLFQTIERHQAWLWRALLGAVLLAIAVNCTTWLLLAIAGCHACGASASSVILLGVGMAIAPLAGIAFVAAMLADSRTRPAVEAYEAVRWPGSGVDDGKD